MYLPKHFEQADAAVVQALLRERPFATLVSHGAGGLDANHMPMEYDPQPAPHGRLRFHVARNNPVWRELAANPAALAIFQGPQAYVTPSWYPEKQTTGKVVPTWNYAIVHARGTVRVHDDPVWLRAHLERLVDQQESAFPKPWGLGDAPADYLSRMFEMIVGLELTVTSLQAKWKVSQNRQAADREGVARGLRASAHPDDLAVADLVEPR